MNTCTNHGPNDSVAVLFDTQHCPVCEEIKRLTIRVERAEYQESELRSFIGYSNNKAPNDAR